MPDSFGGAGSTSTRSSLPTLLGTSSTTRRRSASARACGHGWRRHRPRKISSQRLPRISPSPRPSHAASVRLIRTMRRSASSSANDPPDRSTLPSHTTSLRPCSKRSRSSALTTAVTSWSTDTMYVSPSTVSGPATGTTQTTLPSFLRCGPAIERRWSSPR